MIKYNKLSAVLLLLSISPFSNADQYVLQQDATGVVAHSIENVVFTLSKTSFSPTESITATWKITGTPDSIFISGYGKVNDKEGAITFIPGNVSQITISATVNGISKNKTIPVSVVTKNSFVSCNDIKSYNPSATSGVYQIDPDGSGSNSPFGVYCDMATEGGGWTLIYKQIGFDTADFWDGAVNMAALQSPSYDQDSNGSLHSQIQHSKTMIWSNSAYYAVLNGDINEISNSSCYSYKCSSIYPYIVNNVGMTVTSTSTLVMRYSTAMSGLIVGYGTQPWCSPVDGRYNGVCKNGSTGKGNWLMYVK